MPVLTKLMPHVRACPTPPLTALRHNLSLPCRTAHPLSSLAAQSFHLCDISRGTVVSPLWEQCEDVLARTGRLCVKGDVGRAQQAKGSLRLDL